MSANPPGRGDENEWDVSDQSGSQWGSPPPAQPPHPQSGPSYAAGPPSYPAGPPPQPPQQHGARNQYPYPQGQGSYPQGPGQYQQGTGSHPQGSGPYQQGPSAYPQGPGPYQQQMNAAPKKKRGGLIALFAVIVIVIGVGIGWAAATLFPRDSDNPSTVAASEEPTSEQTGSDQSATASAAPEPTEDATALPDDPKKALKQLADTDGKAVTDDLNGEWVPQLSSKKVGLEAEGRTWDEQAILDEHQELREEFPRVKLVWSGDFKSFKEGNFWVTVVGIGYSNPDDALSWCSSHGLGPDSCYAKQLNTSGGYEGTTRLQD